MNIAQKILYLINTKTVGMSATVNLDLEVSRFILVNKASLNKDSGLQLLALVLYTI